MRPEDIPQESGDPMDEALNKLTHQQIAALYKRLKERAESGD